MLVLKIMKMRSEAAWSYISPIPIQIYDKKFDAHLVFWNGVAMTRTYALLIYSQLWLNIYPTLSLKKAAYEEYDKIYRAGGFHTRDWDSLLGMIFDYNLQTHLIRFLNNKDSKFLTKLTEQYSSKDALNWFVPSKEIQAKT